MSAVWNALAFVDCGTGFGGAIIGFGVDKCMAPTVLVFAIYTHKFQSQIKNSMYVQFTYSRSGALQNASTTILLVLSRRRKVSRVVKRRLGSTLECSRALIQTCVSWSL